jgi:DNA-binding CsgD family transcriptional regulator
VGGTPTITDASKIIADVLLQNVDELCIIDRDYRVVWAKGELVRDLSCGKRCYELFQALNTPCPNCPVKAVLDSGRPCTMKKKMHLSDGSCLLGKIEAFPVYDSDKRLSYVLKIGRDFTPARSKRARSRPAPNTSHKRASGILTCREMDVLRFMVQGCTNMDIARLLKISPHTVKTHLVSVFNKLGVGSRAEATLLAMRLKVIH